MCTYDHITRQLCKGQWLMNTKLFPFRCDLSTCGEYMVLKAKKYAHKWDCYTFLCRPPYFTAEYYWCDAAYRWSGGGTFTEDGHLVICRRSIDAEGIQKGDCPWPSHLTRYDNTKTESMEQERCRVHVHSGFNGVKPVMSSVHPEGWEVRIDDEGGFYVGDEMIYNFANETFRPLSPSSRGVK